MQFAVPQFTEVEDRLIGSLTLKQFLVLLGTGGIVLFFWSLLGPSFPFFVIAVPIALVGIGAALGKYNGRPMFAYLMPFLGYVSSTKLMVFRRENNVTSVSKSEPIVKEKPKVIKPEDLEPAESRLKKLAYLLDQKTAEEGEIISHDTREAIKVTSAPKISLGKTVTGVRDQIKEQIRTTAHILDQPDLKPAATSQAVSAPKPARLSKPSKPAPTFTPQPKKPEPKKFDPSSFLQI